MATKECPYCHKEIADEAILCKYCHNLLIGGNQDIESAAIANRERARQKNAANASNTVDRALGAKRPVSRSSDEDLTREFSTVDAADYQEKTRAFTVPKQAAPQPKRPEPQQARQPGPQPSSNYYDDDEYYDDDQYYDDDDQYYDDDGYYDDTYEDDGYDDDGRYAQNSRSSRAAGNSRNYYAGGGNYYGEDDYDDEDESANKKKKIFIITALITVSVIAVVALAIFVGYKLVGFAKGEDSSSLAAGSKTSSVTKATKITESTTTSKPETTTTTKSSTEEQTTTTTEQTTTETTTDTQWSPTETQTETQTQTQTQTQQTETQQSQTQQGGTDQAQVLANVATALADQNASGIKSYEYRSEDDGAVYLYVFTNDNHAYSVAYFKSSGRSKIVQAW